jgi:amino-acid N-acetyltransferase
LRGQKERFSKLEFDRIEPAKFEDVPKIIALMNSAGLTTEGLEDAELYVIRENGRIVASVGLESWGAEQGLLRSLVVLKELRGKGLGSLLVSYLLETGRKRNLKEVFLLSTDVAKYYVRFGFEIVERKNVSGEVLNSAEFRGACLHTATVMRITL